MFEPKQRFAVAIGTGLAAGALVMFWALHQALSQIRVVD
jgi:hypothetical protein